MQTLTSWVQVAPESDFSIHNIPFGVFQLHNRQSSRLATAIGDWVLDLHTVAEKGIFKHLNLPKSIFEGQYLNDFIALGKPTTNGVRLALQQFLSDESQAVATTAENGFYLQKEVKMLLPIKIGDYTDFYSSREHATNVGIMFRDPANALLPNWLHLPVGYHGRSSSIVVSGTEIHRPKGQMLPPEGGNTPIFGASKRLDFELEMAFVVGKNTQLGDTISTTAAEDHIFGLMLFNDWSARDIQQWEYVPLGPFLGKNFGSTLSAWVVTLEALEPFRCPTPAQDPEVLPYLQFEGAKNYDIHLTVAIQDHIVCRSNFKYMYWNMCQQLAHHTVNGCNMQVGDLLASGTISGSEPDSFGSMLELAWKGTRPLPMPDGTERRFIHDHDSVMMRGYAEKDGIRVGFGECEGKVLPAK